MERLEQLLRGESSSHILPFLWLKGEENETIGRELDQIEECGIREVCLESRPHPDFCGPGWWKNLDYICSEASRRKMKLWILDDRKFPTGYANGGFAKQQEKKKLYLAERHMDIYGPCRSGAVLTEKFIPSDGRLLGILAFPKPDGESLAVSGEGALNLTPGYKNGFVYFDLPEGAYRIFVLFTTRKGGGRDEYMNLIDSDSVRVLIDEVYEKHYSHYQKYFGNTIAGFFSDEPELGNAAGYSFYCTLGKKDQRLPWSGELETMLRRKWGKGFLESLPALWYDAGKETVKIRSEYMDGVTRLVRKCFSEQVGKWCGEHGVEYIGHIIEDDNAHTRMGCSTGHYFREMEGQHMAGVDVVHHQIVPGFTEPVHQWIAGDRDGEFFHFALAKLASSAAHIQGNKNGRALCEMFGNYGWAEGNSLMKWLANHMLVRGINEFTPHAFSMQYPDPDCPPHFYAGGNNPGFDCFTWLMKYMNRSSCLLSGGIHLADAAVLYHAESEWTGGRTMLFQKPARKLMESQLDYDVIPADILGDEENRNLKAVEIKDGKLCIGEERYLCLILPYAQYLDSRVIRFVSQNAPKGLKVYVIDALPEGDTCGNPLPEGWGAWTETVPLGKIAEKVYWLGAAAGNRELSLTNIEGTEALGQFPFLRSLAERQPDGLTVMYFNESVSKKVCAQVKVKNPAYQKVTIYDPWYNRAEVHPLCGVSFPLNLEPGEAVFCCLEENGDGLDGAADFPVLSGQRKLDVNWKISKWELPEIIPPQGVQPVFEEGTVIKAGRELPNLNSPDYWPSFVGIYRYETAFRQEKRAGKRYMLVLPEASDCVKVILNGTDLGFMAGFPGRTEITGALTDGENCLILEAATTLVWRRKDGASTHLQVPATGITAAPVIECYD